MKIALFVNNQILIDDNGKPAMHMSDVEVQAINETSCNISFRVEFEIDLIKLFTKLDRT